MTGDDILLTGATGFLGGYLCVELLRHTSATVHCLVRGSVGEHRLRSRITRLTGNKQSILNRLTAVNGDLTRRRFGMADSAYDALADAVRSIVHSGASVNLGAEFERLEPVNVDGTREVVAFAEHRGPKTLHHISTIGVFAGAREAGLPEVDESTVSTGSMAGTMGYTRTKAIGEQSVRDAAERGLPVTIYRPGLVLANSRTGHGPDSDLLIQVLRASLALGRAPAALGEVPVAPVDYVAQALVALSRHPRSLGRVFHLIQPNPLVVSDFFAAARDYGFHLDEVEAGDWWRLVSENSDLPEAAAALALREPTSYLLAASPKYTPPHIHCLASRIPIAALEIPCPIADTDFFFRVFASTCDERARSVA